MLVVLGRCQERHGLLSLELTRRQHLRQRPPAAQRHRSGPLRIHSPEPGPVRCTAAVDPAAGTAVHRLHLDPNGSSSGLQSAPLGAIRQNGEAAAESMAMASAPRAAQRRDRSQWGPDDRRAPDWRGPEQGPQGARPRGGEPKQAGTREIGPMGDLPCMRSLGRSMLCSDRVDRSQR